MTGFLQNRTRNYHAKIDGAGRIRMAPSNDNLFVFGIHFDMDFSADLQIVPINFIARRAAAVIHRATTRKRY
jgi:hypothetical protein